MSWFRNSLTILAVLALGGSALAAKKEEKPKDAAKAAKSKDAKKKDKDKDKAAGPAAEADDLAGKMKVPLPPGHDAKGLTIPYRDGEGKLQMRFVMAVGKRVDADHMAMTKLIIETFDDTETSEMTIDLPNSSLDLNTRVITTKSGVTIKRADFELNGQTMEFNTETKQGRLGGKVRMKIYNRENETNPDPEIKLRAK